MVGFYKMGHIHVCILKSDQTKAGEVVSSSSGLVNNSNIPITYDIKLVELNFYFIFFPDPGRVSHSISRQSQLQEASSPGALSCLQ